MSGRNIHIYLNDHLAGSVSALELIHHLLSSCGEGPLERFIRELGEEIEQDQAALKEAMRMLDVKESGTRKALAWAMEKAGRAKLPQGAAGEIDLVQALEGLMLGITGKKSLWHTLSTVPGMALRLKGIDLADLEHRAEEQVLRVRARLDEAGKDAFAEE